MPRRRQGRAIALPDLPRHDGAPPDVPIAIRKHHPRVTRITFDWTSLSAATAVATIRDGRASYPVTLRLARRGGAFHVVGLDP